MAATAAKNREFRPIAAPLRPLVRAARDHDAAPTLALSTPGRSGSGLSQSVARADAAPQVHHKSMHWLEARAETTLQSGGKRLFHLIDELLEGERFRQEGKLAVGRQVLLEGVFGIAGDEDDLQAGVAAA